MVNGNVLKSLFLSHFGLNNGFLQFRNKKKMDCEYEDIFKSYFTKPTVDLVNELHGLCNSRTVDADVKALVEQLHEHVNFDGGADE